ncbi:MAG TPA: glycosyltransferase [Candidatus Binataceae bacterium]|nr:glycosyltransferase [Candidatus Binataceae bacterium]
MDRLVARGKFLFEGERKFYARGVSYGPFHPNSRGERYPEPERAAADFAMMRELGANVVRTYVPPPPWMFELAAKHELRLMVGMPWPFHMAFLDSRRMAADIRKTIRDSVGEMRRFADVILAFSIGNEIRSDIVRWHGARAVSRFLAELYDIGKSLAPDSLFTYSNYPSAEYLDLNFLDLICFNVYLHREADFRRYLTHLMATTGERPLVLSETGMDTIREGEAHQAELLGWQARAAFELGLSGFVVFAFTDEWHTGGAEITDWAFGLVTRERTKKRAFDAVNAVFRGALPPPLGAYPKVSVVVPAYNAAATLGACLDSLARLNYPDYETIVADDGSTDATREIAEHAGVRTLCLEHRGLGAARNAALAAATGRYIAFIDADARADRDWLYHLVETITRREAAAAGGPNFPPPPASALAAALCVAPGQPREVRAGDDTLAQLCGCNMIIDREAAAALGGFDPMFTAAGDDVDFSWRLCERKSAIACAPGAVVIHQRRPTMRAYLQQQRGYGHGEELLFRKYPTRARPGGVYGGDSWLGSLLGGARIYYGAFGRGLFQTIYPGADGSPLLQIPLTPLWLGISILLILLGRIATAPWSWLGFAGLAAALASAIVPAARQRFGPARDRQLARIWLGLANFAGPLVRAWARRRRWPYGLAQQGDRVAQWLHTRGRIVLRAQGGALKPGDAAADALRAALVRRGFAAAKSDGYEPYDLMVVLPEPLRLRLNLLAQDDGRVALSWRVSVNAPAIALWLGGWALVLALGGFDAAMVVAIVLASTLGVALIELARIRWLPANLTAAAAEALAALGARAEVEGEEAA